MFVDLVPMRTEFENVHDSSFNEEDEDEAYKSTMRTSVTLSIQRPNFSGDGLFLGLNQR